MRSALVLVLVCVSGSTFAKDAKSRDLRKAELHVSTLDGKPTKLAPFVGKRLTLVNLWATWCGPCVEEMPALAKLHEQYKARGFQIVGIDIDEAPADVRAFLAKRPVSYPVLTSTRGRTAEAIGGLEALPTSLLIDENGEVAETLVGAIEIPELTHLIDETFGVKAGDKKKAR